MEKRTRSGIFLAAALLILLAGIGVFSTGRTGHRFISFRTMGTTAGFSLQGTPSHIRQAVSEGQKAFDDVKSIADFRNPSSELARLNATAADKPFYCSEMMWELLCAARTAYHCSGGAFDISVKPLMDLWGFYRKRSQAPSQAEIVRTRALTGLDKVEFDDKNRTVKFRVKGMALDLGGIAKGYALDRAYGAISGLEISSGVLDLGGNLRLLPLVGQQKNTYRIGIRSPEGDDRVVKSIDVPPGCGVSTSGDYERNITLSGRVYGHIIDPATGIPAPGVRAVTVTAPTACMADWISTAVYLRGEKLAEQLEKKFKDVRIIIIHKQRRKL